MWAIAAGEARFPPARVRAGSPGMISTRLNTASEIRMSRGIMIKQAPADEGGQRTAG